MQQQIIDEVRNRLPMLSQKYPIKTLAFFGSVTRNDFNELSDVDVLVDFQSDDFNLFVELAEELEKITKRHVDLVTKRSLNDRHWNYLKEKLVYA